MRTNEIPSEGKSVPDSRDAWIFPTSFAQRRLWFLDQLAPGNTLYNVPLCFRIRGRLGAGMLERAFATVVDRHEILRTTFREVDGEPMQIVSETSDFRLPVVDLSTLAPPVRDAEAARIVTEEFARPFHLGKGPLMRATLLDLGSSEHILALCFHHIVTDSWSQEILMRELTSAYSSLTRSTAPSLPELPIQYADFAAWQRDAMQGEILEKELRFWRERLTGLTPLDLPQLPGNSTSHPPEGGTFHFELPAPLTAAVRLLAQREGVTLFMALLAGWKCFHARYTGQTDIAIGSAISDRGRTETEGLIGLFLNTLVLRTDLSGNPTVAELLRRVRDTSLEAFAHQEFPFEMIVEELQPARQAGRNPLVRSMFVFMTGEDKTWKIPGLDFEPLPVDESKAKFDVMLHLRDAGATIKAALVYDTALLTPAMARRFAGQYETLLAAMAATPDARLNSLPLIRAEDRERFLHAWNDTAAPFPADRPVHALFREQARRNPDAVAVEDGASTLTYGELDRQSDAIAATLIRDGVQPGDAVAISLPRSSQLIAGILGILKAGAAYVPLDISYPRERLDLMLRESGAKLLIGSGASPALQDVAWRTVDSCLEAPASPAPEVATPPSAPAYIMFTSGSTGVPKGVRVLHPGISRLVINTNYIQFAATDVVAHASNTSFDASTFEIWGALLNGARLVIVPKETLLSPRELAAFIRDRKISVLFLTTPLFNQLAREIPGAFGTLRYLVAGGDVLQPEAASAVLQAAPPAHLVNGYGPTEVTTFAICHTVTEVPADTVSIPIGRPISNTTAYILDSALEPVPAGIAGDLYLGGPGVAGGYLNNPEATAAKFLPDPFSNDPAARLYKTGDLARWREDGVIEFLGRADDQVKIRGFRVELGEVEAAIRRAGNVGDCKVIARTAAQGERQLIAYFTPAAGAPVPAGGALREELGKRLPDYMIPAAFLEVPRFPLNPNGKLAVNELPLPDLSKTDCPAPIESQNTLHSQLVEIWQELLGRKPIGIHDDFFDLGGHSLLAVRMLAMVEERLGVRPGVSVLFENATIEHLAASLINDRQAAATRKPFIAIQPNGTKTPFFFLHGDFAGGGFFCRGLAREIGGDRPFYAIHPHGLEGDHPPRSISVMAEERLQVIRQIQPHGPYLLGGYCNGALVAFEMARLLEAAGESVPAVVIFMAYGSAYRYRFFHWLTGIISALSGDGEVQRDQRFLRVRKQIAFSMASFRYYAAAARELIRRPPGEQFQRIAGKVRRIIRRASSQPPPVGQPAEEPARDQHFWDMYSDASESYVPGKFGGKLVLLWPREQRLVQGEDPAYGWNAVSRQVELVYVPGDHDTSITRNANLSIVGQEMRRALDAAADPARAKESLPAGPSRDPAPAKENATAYELVIEPSHRWIRLSWQELWDYRDLLVLLVRRDFLSKYSQTILGPAWFVIQPLLTTMMFVLIFGRVAQIPTDNIPGPLFYLCGLLGWNFFSQNVTTGATTFTANAHLFGKVYFPRIILPASAIISNLYAFALQFVPFLAFFVYYKFFTPAGAGLHMGWEVLFLPLIVLQASLFSLGVSLWMSASTAKYRDIVHLNQFIIQLWMFATPIIYPLSRIPRRYAWLAWLNPMSAIVESFRITLLGRGTLSAACLATSILLTLAVTATGCVIFQKMERTAVDNI